jgi:hypothetical protein
MRLEWGTELQPSKYDADDNLVWRVEHHLKKVWDKDPMGDKFGNPLIGKWKVTVAWATKIGDRKWRCQFVNHNDEGRTFRSLKAAKAYAVAIITLEN